MSLEPIELVPGALLFKNVLSDSKISYRTILNSKNNKDSIFKWEAWNIFGNQSVVLPDYENHHLAPKTFEDQLKKECIDLFFDFCKVYKEKYFNKTFFEKNLFPLPIPESLEQKQLSYTDLTIYEAINNNYENWHMLPHQDALDWWGGIRQVFNCNIYFNNDYEGGELAFWTMTDKKIEYIDVYSKKTKEAIVIEDYFTYKPEAGDALFLQTDVWHAVLPMKGGSKFYARQLLFDNVRTIRNKYMEEHKENFDAFYELEWAKAKQNRITPILYKSLDEIDFDFQIQYLGQDDTKIPCYISSYKN